MKVYLYCDNKYGNSIGHYSGTYPRGITAKQSYVENGDVLFIESTDITTHTLKMSDIPSPYTNFNFEEISELNFPIPEFSLLNPREPVSVLVTFHFQEHQQTSYDRQLTLTELVMKKLSSLGKALDVFGHYDDENDGFITVSQLKKCLEQISVVFTDQEFTMVFKEYEQFISHDFS